MLVGLTGGIASGKSTAAERLAELGAVVIDADELAREVVAPGTPGLAAVVERFGTDLLMPGPDGAPVLDRAALGRVVFADQRARRDLESIIHPLVRARSAALVAQAPADAVVVQMIPLLVETGQGDRFDRVLVVDVDPAVQLARLMARNGLTRDEAQARIDAQASRDQRLAAATDVLGNDGTREQLRAAVDRWWASLGRG